MYIVDPTAIISPHADIEQSVRGTRIEIGAGVRIDSFVKIKPAGGSGDVFIGAETYINSGTVIYTGNGVRIGAGVLISANCTLAPTNHRYSDINVPIRKQGFLPSKGGILIENDVWLGANCVVLDGARIGKGAIIAAGSIVRGVVPPNVVCGGDNLRILSRRS